MTNPLTEMSGQQIGRLIAALDSLMDGELAVDMLIACGHCAVPYLADFLLKGSPRTISLPRCRAARVLGELGARSTLISYFKDYERPHDGAVLCAEDAVRSTIARELARWNSDEVFQVLLEAATKRVTGGLVLALGEFHRPESIPLLFEVLEDDLCRQDAMKSLRGLPDATRQFGILTIRGLSGVTLDSAGARCRKRATLQLLSELGVAKGDWPDICPFLRESDPGTVIAASKIGFTVAPDTELPEIVIALFEVAKKSGFVQEDEVQQLLDAHPGIAREIALQLAKQRKDSGERPNWLSPSWRILNHVLGRGLESGHPTGA